MTLTLKGKGFFTFLLPECEDGSPAAIVSEARAAGLTHVFVKIADGTVPFGFAGSTDFVAPVVEALHQAGIAVWGWHYVYGDDPLGEAGIAVQRVTALGLDGYVIDAEAEYKQPGKTGAARDFMSKLRRGLPRLPVALSSFRFPNYHPELPWSTFLEKCDYIMPQVYWEQSHNAGSQLRDSKQQCDALPNARAYVPTGAAYSTSGWTPTADDINDFLETAKSLGLEAVNFFSWDYCRQQLPDLWTAISVFGRSHAFQPTPVPDPPQPAASDEPPAATPQPVPEPAPAPVDPATPTPATDFVAAYLAALNSRDLSQVAALYAEGATSVRASVVTNGVQAIARDYADLFTELPDGTFQLVKSETDGDIHTLVWQAGAQRVYTTLVLDADKIASEYLFLA